MLLAFDIGNSTIAAALFDEETLIASSAIHSTSEQSSDEIWGIVSRLLTTHRISESRITAVGISSVVPSITALVVKLCLSNLRLAPFVVSSSLPLGMTIQYAHPEQLGSDRICSAIAGFEMYGGPLIIVDFGTAITYGVIAGNGDFLGGAIALGVRTTAEALHLRTAHLPSVELRIPQRAINTNTSEAIQSGVMFGALDAVHGMIGRIRKELGVDAKVIATGGLSQLMVQYTRIFDAVEPTLVLNGIRILANRLKSC